MKIRDIKELLKHYGTHEYDDWDIVLWDYNNQRELAWKDGTYAVTKDTKHICFPVTVEPVDGVTIDERIKKLYEEINSKKDGTKNTYID